MDIIIDIITLVIKIFGSLVILWGMLVSVIHFFKGCFARIKKHAPKELVNIRLEFGRYILLGLEFFIAADVIQTIFLPSWSELGMLATIVIIRTILSYFLTHEFRIIEKTKN